MNQKMDLMAVVADSDQEFAINALLRDRKQSLGIRDIEFNVQRYSRRDSGVFHEGLQFLADLGFPEKIRRGLLILDVAWEGSPGHVEIKKHLQRQIEQRGWNDTVAVIVVNPEIEAWVWQDSPHVLTALRRTDTYNEMRISLQSIWPLDRTKPEDPKKVFDKARKIPHSASIFEELASNVSLQRCEDENFREMVTTLKRWFPK